MTNPGRIDTHHHVVPPAYAAWLRKKGAEAGGMPIPEWSAESAIALMDKHRIQTAILSVSTPGVHMGDDAEAREKAREVNEFAADGVVLLANSRGIYLGDRLFDPLFEELNQRKAVVFVHPSPLYGADPLKGMPPYIADFLLDTTRAAIRLAGSGTLDRCPDTRIILSHAGGFVPYAAYRIAGAASAKRDFADGLAQLRKFYFDVAISATPTALPSLLTLAHPDRILFATDWPYAAEAIVSAFTAMYERYSLDDALRESIDRRNAESLFPRLRAEAC